MNCYKCGCSLNEKDFCTSCGADVARYKQVLSMSNAYYNEGLEKAQIRDLTGATACLQLSLKLNKRNTQARNLLGLIYFETGETVMALTEWVISKNYQPEKNIADDYITKVQSNPSLLSKMDGAVHKYNQSLGYCSQGIYDMPAIQLRKIIQLHPKLLQARLLLALLYIQSEKWEQAKEQLEICKAVDIGNITTNRFLAEVDEALGFENSKNAGKKQKETAVYMTSGNDTIIQPVNHKESTGLHVFINVCVGLLIGLIIGWFVLGPLRVKMEESSVNEELIGVREQLNIKSTEAEELTQKVNKLQNENDLMSEQLAGYEGASGLNESHKNLLLALGEYHKGAEMDEMVVADCLDAIEPEYVQNEATEEFLVLYNMLKEAVGESVAARYYESGNEAFRNFDYTAAIHDLTKAVYYDPDNDSALYALANAYRENKDYENAELIYEKVIELFPGSEKATKAQAYIAEMQETS